ncbi:hypothetical protein ACLKA7_011884 [Drosophila subpalustris]
MRAHIALLAQDLDLDLDLDQNLILNPLLSHVLDLGLVLVLVLVLVIVHVLVLGLFFCLAMDCDSVFGPGSSTQLCTTTSQCTHITQFALCPERDKRGDWFLVKGGYVGQRCWWLLMLAL